MSETLAYADFVLRIIIATIGGVLIGIERERLQLIKPATRASSLPGVRSFGLLSLYGCLATLLSSIVSNGDMLVWSIVFLASTLGVALFFSIYSYLTMSSRRTPGITTFIVILVAYMVGVFAGIGRLMEAASISILATLLLALKNPAVKLARELKYEELTAIVEVGALAIIVGPLVAIYSREVPLIDIYKIYLFFLLVLTLSLASYGASRIWGARGLMYATVLGSIFNSEATIAGTTRLIGSIKLEESKREYLTKVTTLAIVSTMHVKAAILAIIALALFLEYSSLKYSLGLLLLTLVGSTILFIVLRRSLDESIPRIETTSPLSWYTAIKVTLTYTILILMFKILELVEAPLPLFYALSILGGFANATASIIGLASSASFLGSSITIALMLGSIASATLNKIVYADTSQLGANCRRIIVYYSILLSLIPLLLSLGYLVLISSNIFF
ncbi:MAG: DUF4010 domain-containing protein [Acidilobaceae archaeon]